MTSAMAAPAAGAVAGVGFGDAGVDVLEGGELIGALEQAATSADAVMTRTSRMGTRLAGGPPAASSAAGFANVG